MRFVPTEQRGLLAGDTDLVLVLREAAVLTGRVLDHLGNPVPGAEVHGTDSAGIRTRTAKTDAEGHFDLNVTPGEPIDLEARRGEREYFDRRFTYADDAVARLAGATAGGAEVTLRLPEPR